MWVETGLQGLSHMKTGLEDEGQFLTDCTQLGRTSEAATPLAKTE